GTLVAGTMDNRSVFVWETATGKRRHLLDSGITGYNAPVAYSPAGNYLATCSQDGWVQVWDAAKGTKVRRIQVDQQQVQAVAFSRDGTRLATSHSDFSVRLWDTTGGKLMQTLKGHTKEIQSIAFLPDGKTVVSGSQDETVRLWDVESGKEQRR